MKRVVLGLVLLTVALALWRFGPGRGQDAGDATTEFGQQALYALNLPDLAGKPQALAQWRGQVLVLNFWATWCGPCRKEMPALGRLAEKYASRGVQFVGVSIDEPDKVKAFQARMSIPYPLLLAEEKVLTATVSMGNVSMGLPFTVVLDQTGKIAKAQLGVVDENVLDGLLMTLISQAPGKPAH